jgi:hypothetical protein
MGKPMVELDRFNFWSQKVDYKTKSCSVGCTSDQGGSQEGGGGDCNSTGDA